MKVVIEVLAAPAMLGETCHAWMALAIMADATEVAVPDWIICGGESGNGARRIKPAWVRAVRDECADLGIAFFMKQIGDNHYGWPTNIRGKGHDMDDWPEDLRVRQFPSGKRA